MAWHKNILPESFVDNPYNEIYNFAVYSKNHSKNVSNKHFHLKTTHLIFNLHVYINCDLFIVISGVKNLLLP